MKIYLTNIQWKNRNIPSTFCLDLKYQEDKINEKKINKMIFKEMDSLFNDKCIGFDAETII